MTDNTHVPEPGEEWRIAFCDRIFELAKGEVDVLQVADWALQAQQDHGQRDPREVADEEMRTGTPPIPGEWTLHPGDPAIRSLEIRDKAAGDTTAIYYPKPSDKPSA